jgi:type VII secretion protein EccB
MQTQRDHVHAHQFMMGRMSCALVLGDPTHAEIPARRAMSGLFIGIIVGVVLSVGFLLFGLIVPGGNTAWRQPGSIIVEKETGTRYVFLAGALRPTLNLASARLLAGDSPHTVLTSRKSLKGVPRGAPVGIPGAPQVLPGSADLARGPWLVCLGAGGKPDLNLDPAAAADPLPADRFVVVRNGSTDYLVWRDTKFTLADGTMAAAFGFTGSRPGDATPAWLDSLPSGPDLGAARIDGAGRPGATIAGRAYRIGQIFAQRGTDQLFVLRSDGLAPVSRTEFMLLQAHGSDPVDLDSAAVLAAPKSNDRSLMSRLPDLSAARPQALDGRVVCERQRPKDLKSITAQVVLAAPQRPGTFVRPASGMIIYPIPQSNPTTIKEFALVTDEATRYQLADSQVLNELGLDGSAAVPMPRALLEQIPAGPPLIGPGR